MEYVFAGALALIIISSLVLTIYHVGGDKTGSGGRIIRLECQSCGHQFELTPKEMMEKNSAGPGGMPAPGMVPGMAMSLDCPSCKIESSAIPMTRCPACEKYYVSEASKYPEAYMSGQMPPDICPHCNTDRIQWYHDKAKSRK